MTTASNGPRSLWRSPDRILELAVGLVLTALAARACGALSLTRAPWTAALVAAVVVVAVVGAAWIGARGGGPGDAAFLGSMLFAFVVARLPWVLAAPTIPISDFQFYDGMARQIAAGEAVTIAWPNMGLVAAWGYPVALAAPYALLFADLLVARVFNLVLGVVALVALHGFARQAGGRVVARVACVLFLLWPTQWFFVSVPASEHLALPLVLLASWCTATALDDGPRRRAIGALAVAGVLLGASFATRSVAGAAAMAVVIALLVDRERAFGARLLLASVVVGAFATVVVIYSAALGATLGVTPESGGWWSIFVGSNSATDGAWNEEDAAAFTAQPDPASANRFARAAALARITADPAGYLALAGRKIAKLWDDGTHGVYWSTASMAPGPLAERVQGKSQLVFAAAQAFHVVVLVLAAPGILRAAGRARNPAATVVGAAFLLVATLAHGIVETQPRYNYTLLPVLFVFVGIAVARRAPEEPRRVAMQRGDQASLRSTRSQHSIA